MKQYLDRVRANPVFSRIARFCARPLERCAFFVATQLRKKIWANGATVVYDGVRLKFPVNAGIGIATGIFWEGSDGFEPDTWKVIKYFLLRSGVFVDVGSNIGFYSVLARKTCPQLRVLAYEPVPPIYGKNLAFHRLNDCPVDGLACCAIGAVNGVAEMFLPVSPGPDEETTATLRSDSWQHEQEHIRYSVEVRTLDHVLAQLDHDARILVKIDVEDNEAAVFTGAVLSMQQRMPVFVCEILPRAHGNRETYEAFSRFGYVAFAITSAGLVRFTREDFARKRKFNDFLVIHESMEPDGNFCDPDAIRIR